MENKVSKMSRRDFLKITVLSVANAAIAACGSRGSAPAQEASQAVPTDQPSAQEPVDCVARITVKQGDSVYGSIADEARISCPKINNKDILNSWYKQHGDRKMDTIQPGEELTLNDYR